MRPSDFDGVRNPRKMLSRHIGCQIDLGNIKRGMPGAFHTRGFRGTRRCSWSPLQLTVYLGT